MNQKVQQYVVRGASLLSVFVLLWGMGIERVTETKRVPPPALSLEVVTAPMVTSSEPEATRTPAEAKGPSLLTAESVQRQNDEIQSKE